MTFAHAPGPAGVLLESLAGNWWLLLLRGIAAIAFGVLAFAWPGVTLYTLVIFYGAYAIVDGIFALWAAIGGKGGNASVRWWLALVGVLGILAGIVTFAWPSITALVLLYFIAFWAIATGIFQIVGAIRLRKEIEGEWWLVLAGALSVLFGLILIVRPGEGALAVVWLIAGFAILVGVLHLALAFRLRRHAR